MNLGSSVRSLRLDRGFNTQKELAEACGVSINTISQIELNKVFPKITTLESLCIHLKVSETYLLIHSISEDKVEFDKRMAFTALKESLLTLLK